LMESCGAVEVESDVFRCEMAELSSAEERRSGEELQGRKVRWVSEDGAVVEGSVRLGDLPLRVGGRCAFYW
jgi:hypothetical protein